ncbi:zinc finger AN1 and C2H2 domain-containing stress-associated protein 16 [Canna indica]|uniref:Zinc finger AN1 and C2H2 domain-containing stress-associated protein 16 n=1 Tax=Canna indica TaxID=4628 RepID=A0AAQ3QR74_9LILI|nr:zinc finger AN1 and C2H2 domain-containing stress-associated protein 16 [Canna indica]
MGTPEFPNLGKHCSVGDCRQIDFLPFTCDRCSQVFCLQHRSYINHQCPNGNKKDVTVVICPLCAKGVRLVADEDPNITWESHVNTDCDPSNYQRATKKRRCPVPRCKEVLNLSNAIRCRDCSQEHCLKHRFGPDHNCPGPKKPESGFPFISLLNRSRKAKPMQNSKSDSSSWWGSSLMNAVSNVRASAESGMQKFSNVTTQALQKAKNGIAESSSSSELVEQCVQCPARFSTVSALIEHVEKSHQQNSQPRGNRITIDVCPKCSKGFRDPVQLVEHVERDHGGTSRA